MDILVSFAIIILAAIIHASFHLSISVLTLLSGHTLSKERSHLKLVKLIFALIFGTISATILILCTIAFIFETFYSFKLSILAWTILCGLSVGTGISVLAFYFRRDKTKKTGTELWVPRSFAGFLNERTKKTKHSAEAFSLGISSIFSEILFIITPISAAALASVNMHPSWQFVAVVVYVSISNFPIFVIGCLISGGTSLAKIQKWRESNKRFLQFSAGTGLFLLAFLIFSNFLKGIF